MIFFRQHAGLILGAVLFAFCAGESFAVSLGATKDEVIAERGMPTSHAAAGTKEILTYPKGIRIVLEEGKVVGATGITLVVEEPTPEPTPSPTPTPIRKPTPEPVEDLEPTPSPVPLKHLPPPPSHHELAAPVRMLHLGGDLPLSGKMLVLGVHLILTLLALFLAFRFWSVTTVHSGLLMIALIDLGIHAGLEFLGNLTAGISSMPAVETLVAWTFMVVTLREFCTNKNVQDAVRTASVVTLSVALIQLGGTLALLHFMAR